MFNITDMMHLLNWAFLAVPNVTAKPQVYNQTQRCYTQYPTISYHVPGNYVSHVTHGVQEANILPNLFTWTDPTSVQFSCIDATAWATLKILMLTRKDDVSSPFKFQTNVFRVCRVLLINLCFGKVIKQCLFSLAERNRTTRNRRKTWMWTLQLSVVLQAPTCPVTSERKNPVPGMSVAEALKTPANTRCSVQSASSEILRRLAIKLRRHQARRCQPATASSR